MNYAVLLIGLLVACGCAPETEIPTPKPSPTPQPNPAPGPTPPMSAAIGEPVSDEELSVADIVEKALPSVVQIIAGDDAGTGFIIDDEGLAVTRWNVAQARSHHTRVPACVGSAHLQK